MHALSRRAFHICLVHSGGRRALEGISNGPFTDKNKENMIESVCLHCVEETIQHWEITM
jgi:hypothetical protein